MPDFWLGTLAGACWCLLLVAAFAIGRALATKPAEPDRDDADWWKNN